MGEKQSVARGPVMSIFATSGERPEVIFERLKKLKLVGLAVAEARRQVEELGGRFFVYGMADRALPAMIAGNAVTVREGDDGRIVEILSIGRPGNPATWMRH